MMRDGAPDDRLSTVSRTDETAGGHCGPGSGSPGGGVELSEEKLRQLAAALHGPDPFGRRSALRIPVEGFVTMAPIPPANDMTPRQVGVYDLSRTGIALVNPEPIPAGSKFNLLFPRGGTLPIEVLCTVRHCRREGGAHIVGAEFGVSWLSALTAAMVGPSSPATPAASSN